MSALKFVSDMMLEKEELTRFKKFLTKEGFNFDFLADTEEFGVVHNTVLDPNFDFFRVSAGNTFNTIKVGEGYGYDLERNLIHQRINSDEISVGTVGVWYWVKIAHSYSNREQGLVSIGGVNKGLMNGVGTEFKSILRGQPNFPSKIKFLNSVKYTEEYEILEVIDDNNVIVNGTFNTVETNLKFAVVGTFTPGYYTPDIDKYIFQYDDCTVQLVQELIFNTKPNLTKDKEFFIARVRNNGSSIDIIDYRRDYIHRTRLEKSFDLLSGLNPLVGLEYIQKIQIGGRYFYEIRFDWKFKINNEIQLSQNSKVSVSLGNGGAFKSPSDFTDGDFNGWRYYYDDGDYSTVITSVKTGNSFLLQLDSVKTGNSGNFICPPCEAIEIQYNFKRPNGSIYYKDSKLFEITTENPVIAITQDMISVSGQTVEMFYKYKNLNKKTKYLPFNNTTYYNDTAFDTNGNLININNVNTSNVAILGTNNVQSFTGVPKFCPIPWRVPAGTNILDYFDATGLGFYGEFIGWAICNGANGTDDWRGVTPIGATRIDVNNPIPNQSAPPLSSDASTAGNEIDVRQTVGESKHQLNANEIPPLTMTVTDTGHNHASGTEPDNSNVKGGGGSQFNIVGARNGAPSTPPNYSADEWTLKATTGITVAFVPNPTTGDKPHENRQRSKGVIWIERIS